MSTEAILNFIALAIYICLVVYPVLSDKRDEISLENYTRGKGSYSVLIIAVAMTVTMIGPADALALSQNGFKYGLVWSILPIGAALAQLVTGFLFANKIKSQFPEIKSIGDIYGIVCSRSSKGFTGFIAFIQSIAFSGVLILAGGQVLETFLHLDKVFGMVLTAVVVGFYTSYNGFVGVIQTDKLQGFFMGSMLIVLLVVSFIILIQLDASALNKIIVKNNFLEEYNFHLISTLFLGYFLGELLLPPYCIRMSVSKTPIEASKSFKLASVILVFWYVIIALSGSIGEFVTTVTPSDENLILVNVIRSIVSNEILYYGIGSFCLLVFISLIHSTFDTFLNNGAVSFSRDILGNIFKLSEDQELWISKQVTVAIAVLGLVVAIWKNDLIDILFIGYTVWVPTILGSLIWILFHPNNKLLNSSFWLGLLVGAITWVLFEFVYPGIIPAILIGLLLNYLTIYLLQLKQIGIATHRPS